MVRGALVKQNQVRERFPLDADHDVVICVSKAAMPAKCKALYQRIGVAVVTKDQPVAMIGDRARNVVRWVWRAGPLCVGTMVRSQMKHAMDHAHELVKLETQGSQPCS